MDYERMSSAIMKIIEEHFGVPYDAMKSNKNTFLILPPFSFNAISLSYLYIVLVEEFNLRVPANVLQKYSFITIDSISNLCCKYCDFRDEDE